MTAQSTKNLTDRIPAPEEVRSRLSANLREAQILRQLLRVSERAARQKAIATVAEARP